MKKLTIIFTLFLIGICGQSSFAQKSSLDKTTFVKAVNILEQDPFIKDAKKYREAMTLYLIETSDVSVVLCTSDLTKPLFEKKYKFSNELFSQNMFGNAAYKLENPGEANNENAAQLAGLESALRAYEAMVKANPKAQLKAADDLITKRNNGELARLVADTKCG